MGNICSFSLSCDALFSRCLDCTVRKAAYINELEDNLSALPTKLEELIAARNAVERRVNLAKQQLKEPTDPVELWFSRVQAVEAKVGEQQKLKSQEIEKLCLEGYCSRNCKSSYEFGKSVANTLQELNDLKAEGVFEEVAQEIPEDPADEIPMDPTIVGQQWIFDKIWSCLNEEQVGIVGLYGKGGVGKTTLLNKINNSFCNDRHHFDVVIYTVVSKDYKLENIQDKIGKKIGLSGESWSEKNPNEKAREILKFLNKKKFMLLLDDIWERVDLIQLGVPPVNLQSASKVVFTTRLYDVCGQMGVGREFGVECLGKEEAWELFKERVGSNILQSRPEIRKLAQIAAKECRGLPLALNIVGRAMSCRKKLEEWEDAVEVLRTSAFEFPGMEEKVYALLKFSYDHLRNDRIRSCFLYCCLFPENYRIHKKYLIECWLAEGLLGEYDGYRAINRGYAIIRDLVHACLLEEEDDRVVMHDVVREMALWIACEIDREKENFLVQAGVRIYKAPEIGKWEGLKRISLMKNRIEDLLETPRCPNLQTLFLGSNRCLSIISSDFFQFMPSLRVLNLARSSLKELPSGISNLVSLEHLDLSSTGLRKLPEEMKELVKLKYLSVSRTNFLHTFPPKLLSSLSMLRTLSMEDCGLLAKQLRKSILYDGGESLIEELLGLEHLNAVHMNLQNDLALQKFSSSPKFQNCCVSLRLRGIKDSKSLNVLFSADTKHLRSLRIHYCDFEEPEIDCTGLRQFVGFQQLHKLVVGNCNKLKDMTWLILAPNLKEIQISICSGMEEIINVEKFVKIQEMKRTDLIPFANLESLVLKDLPKLDSICQNALPFLHLKGIVVVGCPELKKLPLDSNRAKERKIVIKGGKRWWKKLQWEDAATQVEFCSCFKCLKDEKEENND